MPRKKTFDTSSHTQDIAESWARERPDVDRSTTCCRSTCASGDMWNAEDQRWKQTFGLSNAEVRTLFALRRGGEQRARRPTDLFRALLVTSGAISKQISRLEALEFVAREPDPRNAGGFLVRLTPAGKRVADHAMDELAKNSVVSRLGVSLDPDERRQLTILCERILFDLEADHDDVAGVTAG